MNILQLLVADTLGKKDLTLLEKEFPYICNDVTILINRPFRFVWDSETETASTDCKALINVNPKYFIDGFEQVGYGSVYHECGHILNSPFAPSLLARAINGKNDRTLWYILQIIIDRKDDLLLIDEAPGFADVIRKRLLFLVLNSCYEKYQKYFEQAGISKIQAFHLVRNLKPADVYEDFFLSAKCHKRPRFPETSRAMKYLRSKNLKNASADKIFWLAQKVKTILGEAPYENEVERAKAEIDFLSLMQTFRQLQKMFVADPQFMAKLKKIAKVHVATVRNNGLKQLAQKLKQLGQTNPGPISTGLTDKVKVVKVPNNQKHEAVYNKFLEENKSLLAELKGKLRFLESPAYIELFCQEEGELDLDEVASIAVGFSDVYTDVIIERDIDAELHLAIDLSSSMSGRKLDQAKRLAVFFSEAILALAPACQGYLWGYNSEAVYDLGPLSRKSGLVDLKSANWNSDTHMLKAVGEKLSKSLKKRKVLIVLCDDGPDDMAMVKKMTQQLLARGIIVVHLMVGVHGVPAIYPVELIYTSMQECLQEFGEVLQVIVRNLK